MQAVVTDEQRTAAAEKRVISTLQTIGGIELESSRILVFAGTTEGRELAEFLDRQRLPVLVCTATDYGKSLICPEKSDFIRVRAGRLDSREMAELISRENISITVDATHPYAAEASDNIEKACAESGCRYIRLLRKSADKSGGGDDCIYFSCLKDAVSYLNGHSGCILAATGSKELTAYREISGWQERVFARILSVEESMKKALELGFSGKNLICMQGPFSKDMNLALLRQTGAAYMVSKESGRAGGFEEKLQACREAGAKLLVISRPEESKREGKSPLEVRALLVRLLERDVRRDIVLAGIGMGSRACMTQELKEAAEQADILIGAERMLEAFSLQIKDKGKASYCEYRPERILSFLREHPEYEKILILFSGDTGFYSGAENLCRVFEGAGLSGQFRILPGISSLSALCAKVHTGWEDAFLLSLHGRRENLAGAVRLHRKVFVLAGRPGSVEEICRELLYYGLEDLTVHIGWDLSYPGESLMSGCPRELLEKLEKGRKPAGSESAAESEEAAERVDEEQSGYPGGAEAGIAAEKGQAGGKLAAVLIINPHPDETVYAGRADESFERILQADNSENHPADKALKDRSERILQADAGSGTEKGPFRTVPMTKSEVRALILSKLQPERRSIIYDIGAGTGSVSVECALMIPEGRIFAIECREDAARLISRNARSFAAGNLTVVRGFAPEAMEALPAPDRAFIGGSSGRLEDILRSLLRKNPYVRLVISTITLETLTEALRCLKEMPFSEPQIVSVSIARSKNTSAGHLMTGLNPVYLISTKGCGMQGESM